MFVFKNCKRQNFLPTNILERAVLMRGFSDHNQHIIIYFNLIIPHQDPPSILQEREVHYICVPLSPTTKQCHSNYSYIWFQKQWGDGGYKGRTDKEFGKLSLSWFVKTCLIRNFSSRQLIDKNHQTKIDQSKLTGDKSRGWYLFAFTTTSCGLWTCQKHRWATYLGMYV